MESIGTITTSEYLRISAKIVYENNQLIFSTKPGWVGIVFGFVGEALAPYNKERFRINISDITSLSLSENRTGKPVYKLTLNNNDFCKIVFTSHDKLTNKLKSDLKDKTVIK